MYVPEAVAVAVAMRPELITAESWPADVETEGVLTYGATVIDRRRHTLDCGGDHNCQQFTRRGAARAAGL